MDLESTVRAAVGGDLDAFAELTGCCGARTSSWYR